VCKICTASSGVRGVLFVGLFNEYCVVYIQGPPKRCIHTLTKENSMLYVSTNFNCTSQVEHTLR